MYDTRETNCLGYVPRVQITDGRGNGVRVST